MEEKERTVERIFRASTIGQAVRWVLIFGVAMAVVIGLLAFWFMWAALA